MKRIITVLRGDRTVRSASLMVGGRAAANIGAYLYHLTMGHLLGPVDYGVLQSLISLSNILNVPLVALNTVLVKYVSMYVGKGEREKIAWLYRQIRKASFILLLAGGGVFLVFSDIIMRFLHLDSWINVLILDGALFVGLVNVVNRATLQGLSLFTNLVITQFIEGYGKALFGLVAVLAGLGVPGAFGAFVFVIVLSYLYMSRILGGTLGVAKPYPLPLRAMGHYAVPSFFSTISVIALYNTDVILVRHFLSAYEAGLYAGLSVLGKIIFFGTSPVTATMFPLVSEAHAEGREYRKVFLSSLIFLLAIAGGVTIIFSLAPSQVMKILLGTGYAQASGYLVRFSIFMSMCAIINLFIHFFLSIHRVRAVSIVVMGALIQATALWLFHPNISTVITISLTVTTVITVILSFNYIYVTRS